MRVLWNNVTRGEIVSYIRISQWEGVAYVYTNFTKGRSAFCTNARRGRGDSCTKVTRGRSVSRMNATRGKTAEPNKLGTAVHQVEASTRHEGEIAVRNVPETECLCARAKIKCTA